MGGMDATVINPRVIFVQSSEPDDKTEGKMWYDTTTSSLFVSNGSSYVSVGEDTAPLQKLIQENALQILINSAGASTTLNDWESLFPDRFTDADGQLDSIDTGNTTATFNIDHYENFPTVSEAHGLSYNASGTFTTDYYGHEIHTNEAFLLTTVTKNNNSTPTKCYLYLKSTEALLSTATFVGNIATFNYELADEEDYYIVCGSDGSSYDLSRNTDAGTWYPYNHTNINYTQGAYINGSSVWATFNNTLFDFTSLQIGTTPLDTIIQTDKIDVTANPTAHQVFCHNTLTGNGSVNYDISFDNGSTYDTAQELDTQNGTAKLGSEMILKLNLNGTVLGDTAKAEDYAVLLFY